MLKIKGVLTNRRKDIEFIDVTEDVARIGGQRL